MIHAYAENKLYTAQKNMAIMFDYATNYLNIELEQFVNYYISSKKSQYFENGDSHYLCGMSGIELTHLILEENGINKEYVELNETISMEYWLGYYLAYYLWYTSFSLKEVLEYISINNLLMMYEKYHQMDVIHFVDDLNEIIQGEMKVSNLQKYRKQRKLTQASLAKLTGIPLRTLQKYEIEEKELTKASFEAVMKLSKALCVDPMLLINKTK